MATIFVAGHTLPSFPEWDRTKYPYAYVSFAGSNYAYLRVCDRLGHIWKNVAGNCYGDGKSIYDDDAVTFYSCKWVVALSESVDSATLDLYPGISRDSWLLTDEDTYSLNYAADNGPHWANTTLYDADGNVFIEGSDPIIHPVTEASGDGFSLFNGYKLLNLPEIDTATYPYITMQRIPYEKGGYISHVRYSATPFYYNADTGVVTNDGDAIVCDYINSAYSGSVLEWTGFYTVEGGTLTLEPETVIWTNMQMLDSAGAAWLETSEVIPLDGLMVIEWDGRTDNLVAFAFEGRTYYWMSGWTPISTELTGTYVAYADGTRRRNFLMTAEAVEAGVPIESATFMYLIDNFFAAHISGRLTYNGTVTNSLMQGLYSCLHLIAYDPASDGGVYTPAEGDTSEDVIEEEPEVVETLTPAEERQILLLGWQAGNAVRRTLISDNNAVLINGVLYIKNANAIQTDTTLEVY